MEEKPEGSELVDGYQRQASVLSDQAVIHFPKGFKSVNACVSEVNPGFSQTVHYAALARLRDPEVSTLEGKVIIIGNIGAGKTSLVNRFCRREYTNEYSSTIGIDFRVEEFNILDCPFHLQIWDTAGQEQNQTLAAPYYKGAKGIVVVYDMTDDGSHDAVLQWAEEAVSVNDDPNTPLFIVGTKSDLIRSEKDWERCREKGCALAEKLDCDFWATSACDGDNVRELFHKVAADVFQFLIVRRNSVKHNVRINLDDDPSKHRGNCVIS